MNQLQTEFESFQVGASSAFANPVPFNTNSTNNIPLKRFDTTPPVDDPIQPQGKARYHYHSQTESYSDYYYLRIR